MKYDQAEAKNRFEGLLGLFQRAHEKSKQRIDTWDEYTAIASEVRHLVEAFDNEMDLYLKYCGRELMPHETTRMVLEIQGHAACTGMHLQVAGDRLDRILMKIGNAKPVDEALRWN